MLAESLGGYESLAELPSLMTHASVPVEIRKELGIGDNLIRLSVGCEDSQDLINDLDQALNEAFVCFYYYYLKNIFCRERGFLEGYASLARKSPIDRKSHKLF
jgi:hypothetical protein